MPIFSYKTGLLSRRYNKNRQLVLFFGGKIIQFAQRRIKTKLCRLPRWKKPVFAARAGRFAGRTAASCRGAQTQAAHCPACLCGKTFFIAAHAHPTDFDKKIQVLLDKNRRSAYNVRGMKGSEECPAF